ncbi:MAG: hypothetical protein RBS57_14140, partial [Desulforhabdus sp.]|nr:hypothetical protein [Desulforhabdus sp.]
TAADWGGENRLNRFGFCSAKTSHLFAPKELNIPAQGQPPWGRDDTNPHTLEGLRKKCSELPM